MTGWHPDDEQLLRALDGEGRAREMRRVRTHLETCWSCRVRMEKMEAAISRFMDYRNALGAALEAPPDSRQNFERRLDASFVPPLSRFRSLLAPRFAVAAALILLVAAGLRWISRTPVVSASELLQRAAQAEERAQVVSAGLEVRQKVRIRAGNRTFERQITHGHPVKTATEDDELARVFEQNLLDWNDPLSARAFARWRELLPAKVDDVRTVAMGLSLTTRRRGAAPEGTLREASLEVRARDSRPVRETLLVNTGPSDQEVEISEISYEVVPVATETFSAGSPKVMPAITAPPVPASAPLPSERELASSELEARVALNSLRADLGEQIEIRPGAGSVEISGTVSETDRRNELSSALAVIPFLHVSISTLDDVARVAAPPDSITGLGTVSAETPPIQDLLVQRFPQQDDRETFTRQVLSHMQEALEHAWAVRRLAERYTDDQTGLLTASDRARLDQLVRQHTTAALEQVRDAGQLMRPLLPSVEKSNEPEPADWRESAQNFFRKVEALDRTSTQLFTGSGRSVTDLLTEFATLYESLHQESIR